MFASLLSLLVLFLIPIYGVHTLKNWAGNIDFKPQRYYTPNNKEALLHLVRTARGKIRVIGTGHTFNTLVDTPDTIISMKNFNSITSCCHDGVATVGGGITYAQLAPILELNGWALPNMASLPHISLIGAAATGTHGSGVNNTGLASAIKSIKFVDARNEFKTLDTSSPGIGPVLFGLLGPIYEMTLQLVPSFKVKQCVYGPLPFSTWFEHHKAIFNAAYSVGLFTDYANSRFTTVWVKHKIQSTDSEICEKDFFGAPLINEPVHPIAGIDPSATTTQGAVGKWYEKLPHFRHDHTPSAGEELQAEFFVSRKFEVDAFKAVAKVFEDESLRGVVQTSEVRTMKADGFYLSPCREDSYGCLAIHCTMIKNWERVKPAVELIQNALTPFNARPHFGKLFTLSPQYIQKYYGQQLNQFRELVLRYDPQGKFHNDFVGTYLMQPAPALPPSAPAESEKQDL